MGTGDLRVGDAVGATRGSLSCSAVSARPPLQPLPTLDSGKARAVGVSFSHPPEGRPASPDARPLSLYCGLASVGTDAQSRRAGSLRRVQGSEQGGTWGASATSTLCHRGGSDGWAPWAARSAVSGRAPDPQARAPSTVASMARVALSSASGPAAGVPCSPLVPSSRPKSDSQLR